MLPLAQDEDAARQQLAHLRHELLTLINHVLGLTEIQIEEAPDAGLTDYVPAFREINTGGRAMLAIVEDELTAVSRLSDLRPLNTRLELAAAPVLGQAKKLEAKLRDVGRRSVAEETSLVLSALQSLLSLSQQMVQDTSADVSSENVRK